MSKKEEPSYLKQYEEDRHDLIHKIVFNSTIEKWDAVDKYKELYYEIYGPFEILQYQSVPPIVINDDMKRFQ